MGTPTNGSPYEARVMFELMNEDGVPERVHVWQHGGRTFVSFPQHMEERRATEIVARCRALAAGIDVSVLFTARARKVRRLIKSTKRPG